MFERGKKEGVLDEGAERPRDVQRANEPASQRAAGKSGECAVIGRSIEIDGQVRGNEDLRIEGDVSGTVELRSSNLTIGKEGKVKADIYAKSIVVDGTTEGDLYATESVNVHINAKVRGNITAPKVGIAEGCKFKGSIEMDQEAVDKALGKAHPQDAAKPAADRQPGKAADAKGTSKKVAGESASSLNRPTGAA